MIYLKHRPETLMYENDLVKEYIESLPSGSNFYDLGSCVGTYGILAYSRGLNVCCFEVDKVNFDALNENFFWNFGFEENFKSYNIGIADKKAEIELRIGQPEIGGHHKTLALDSFCGHPNALQQINTTVVPVDSLDNLIKKHKLPPPDHIKIDIDGSEYAFLLGAKESLEKTKSLIIELYEESKYFKEILDILEKKHMFKLKKISTDLEPGLKDYWFEK